MKELLSAQASVALFFDAGKLERYDSELRTNLTAGFREHGSRIARLDVLVSSRLVAMGVSVANLALGGIVKSHSRSESFRTALQTEIRARNVVGFSIDVLVL